MHFIIDSINNYNNYNLMYESLGYNDKIKIDKILYNNDKKSHILSKYLFNNILTQKYNLDYNNIYFNDNGKPLINGIYFNISHSHEYVVLAFSKNNIGIDIEKIREVDIKVIDFFCTENEKKYILEGKNKYKNLFEIFCLKEAYFKMLGTSILNAKNIEFKITKNKIICTSNDNLNIIINNDINGYIVAIIEKIREN